MTVDVRGISPRLLKYPSAKVVYLDQNAWSNLAEGHFNRAEEYTAAAQFALELRSTNKAIFPLSLVHWLETSKDSDSERRARNGSFMTMLYAGATLLPVTLVRSLEISDACSRLSGEEPINLGPLVLRKGISHMAGLGIPKVVLKGAEEATVREINRVIAEATLDPKAFFSLVKNRLDEQGRKTLLEDAKRSVSEVEKVRGRNAGLPKRRRYLLELGAYFSSSLLPRIAKCTLDDERGLKALDSITRNKKLLLQFFASMPASHCFFELEMFRSMQMQRPVRLNDILDLIALSVAIPYCHIVVTERMWAECARELRFKEQYGTDVLSSVKELPLILDSLTPAR